MYFRQKQFIEGDRFLYFHVPYDVFVICTKMNELLRTCHKDFPLYAFYSKLSNNGFATLSLLEDNFLDNAYPICRTAIEIFLQILVLNRHQAALKKYQYLSKVEVNKSCCGIDYPTEFIHLFENRKNQKEDKLNMFLHFGYVDDIVNYHDIVKTNPYSISGLIRYLKATSDAETRKKFIIIKNFYTRCHTYSHGNTIGIVYPLLYYFEISIMLYLVIPDAYDALCRFLNKNSIINNIDILKKVDEDYLLLLEQYNNRSTNNFESYYQTYKKTN